MPGKSFRLGGYVCHLDYVGEYKPGDPPPDGYCDWHAWAETQYKAGLRQKRCGICSLLGFPQELSGKTVSGIDARKRRYVQPVCKKCEAKVEVVKDGN